MHNAHESNIKKYKKEMKEAILLYNSGLKELKKAIIIDTGETENNENK